MNPVCFCAAGVVGKDKPTMSSWPTPCFFGLLRQENWLFLWDPESTVNGPTKMYKSFVSLSAIHVSQDLCGKFSRECIVLVGDVNDGIDTLSFRLP